MSKRQNLVALDGGELAPDTQANAAPESSPPPVDELVLEDEFHEEEWEEERPRRNLGWIVPTLAVLLIAAWTGFFGWVHKEELLAGATPETWLAWIVDWSVPVLLVVALWLLAMRNSRREAARFGETARLLATESAALETRLSIVNRELSLARDFIASQSRDLESLGRIAAERLSTNADRLQDLIRDNGEQVNAIGSVSDTAVANMDKLRDQLPVISNAARDVTSQIGNAGNTAQSQLDELVSGFRRLNEFGTASERQVDGLRDKISETLEELGQRTDELEKASETRFEAMRARNEEFRLELEARETDSLASIRRRAEELGSELAQQSLESRQREDAILSALRKRLDELRFEGDALTSSVREGQEQAQTVWADAVEGLQTRVSEALREISRIDETAINKARERLEALSEAAEKTDAQIGESAQAFDNEFSRRRAEQDEAEALGLARLERRISEFDSKIVDKQQEHLAHVAGLAERGEALAQRFDELDRQMARLTAQGSDETTRLKEQTAVLAEKLSQSRAILEDGGAFLSHLTDDAVRLLEIIRSTSDHSEGKLSKSIEVAEARLSAFHAKAEELQQALGDAESKSASLSANLEQSAGNTRESLERVEAIDTHLDNVTAKSRELAKQAREELQSAITQLEQASSDIFGNVQSEQAEAVREIAERIGNSGSEAIERALQQGARSAIAELEEAARLADERGRATAIQLRDQLAKVNELAGNLEQRVAQARAKAEEQVDRDFTRRMAMITESLNSCAIDLSRAFDTEVSDTAWHSYLKGDRGIFTRRAVRLLNGHEVRGVCEIYEQDGDFREAVNRYIHDFEGMLRNVLSTRDGHSLAVTLLSSDIGKLYVAMAQSIERLRD
jgi:chromosome segregation ATPase